LPTITRIARHLGKADQLASIVVDRIDHDACPEPTAILAHTPALGLMAPSISKPRSAISAP